MGTHVTENSAQAPTYRKLLHGVRGKWTSSDGGNRIIREGVGQRGEDSLHGISTWGVSRRFLGHNQVAGVRNLPCGLSYENVYT